ncbi:hypothetical protein ACLK11_21845 [Escherichia coli]
MNKALPGSVSAGNYWEQTELTYWTSLKTTRVSRAGFAAIFDSVALMQYPLITTR